MAVAGEAYLAVGDFPRAAQYFAQTTALDPKNVAARTRLGQVRFAEGDTEGAIRDLEAASALDPNVSAADLALIANLLRQKQFDQALAAVGRLEKKQPNNPLVYNLKGIVYLTKRDPVNARANFEQDGMRAVDGAGFRFEIRRIPFNLGCRASHVLCSSLVYFLTGRPAEPLIVRNRTS